MKHRTPSKVRGVGNPKRRATGNERKQNDRQIEPSRPRPLLPALGSELAAGMGPH